MRKLFDFLAILFNVLTVIGGGYAAVILVKSVDNISRYDAPDFSSVIAISYLLIPYCLARTFRSLADRAAADVEIETAPCPACLSQIPFSASVCRYCQEKLIPVGDEA